eukprot:m.342263 g.342263  ORF g.342263 m.342263 type:complete len:121 (+) comp27848_c2_seq4:871-1233(+)
MSAKGPIAMELMAMCGYSMSNEADYDRLPELIEHFYNIVKASAPDMCAQYSLAEVTDDLAIALPLFFVSCLGIVVGPLMDTLTTDHPLWLLVVEVSWRCQKTMMVLDSHAVLQKLAATIE